jgi:holliday junction DNA helicase RuvA
MIAYLSGTVRDSSVGEIVLLSHGVGFLVFVPHSYQYQQDEQIELYIHTHLRDDDLALYGLASYDDLKLFKQLISVSGIGPKMALNIFAVSKRSDIISAITDSNLAFFTSIGGIGKKTAQKLILDLNSKVTTIGVDMRSLTGHSDLLDALIALGYRKPEITPIMTHIDFSTPLAGQVKQALKLLS